MRRVWGVGGTGGIGRRAGGTGRLPGAARAWVPRPARARAGSSLGPTAWLEPSPAPRAEEYFCADLSGRNSKESVGADLSGGNSKESLCADLSGRK